MDSACVLAWTTWATSSLLICSCHGWRSAPPAGWSPSRAPTTNTRSWTSRTWTTICCRSSPTAAANWPTFTLVRSWPESLRGKGWRLMQCTLVSAPSYRMKRKESNLCMNKTSLKPFRSPVFNISLCLSRVCSKWLDGPLLHPVPDADAGDHVDVFRVLWDGGSDRRLLRCVGGGGQEQRGLLRRLPTSFTAPFCQRRWCGKKVVGGQWETGETGLMGPKPPLCVGFLLFMLI